MISIFANDGTRLGVSWNGINFNNPTLTRSAQSGLRLEIASFSTPSNFHTEIIADIIKNGGGNELYNPFVGTRVLNLRGNIRADSEAELNDQIVLLQRAFHPLLLQSTLATNHAGTLTWPPPSGLPAWVRTKPLTFTRVMPTDTDATDHADGLFELQYHVVPLELPDPIRSATGQGIGADFEAQFLLMDGGRSFDQTEKTVVGNGTVTLIWGKAPMWPTFEWSMTGAGSATFTITTTQGHMGTAMVLDLSGLANTNTVVVDTRDRTIWVNHVKTSSIYVSGEFPVLRGNGATTVAYTNTTNVSGALVRYRESDYV